MKWVKAMSEGWKLNIPDKIVPARLHGRYGELRPKANFIEFMAFGVAHSYTHKSVELRSVEWLDETKTDKVKVFVPENIAVIEQAIEDIDTCLVEAPIDFLGTDSDSGRANREEKEWYKKWKNALDVLRNSIKILPTIDEQRKNIKT